MLDVRVLVEMWYIWFGGFERVGRKGRGSLNHTLVSRTWLSNRALHTRASRI